MLHSHTKFFRNLSCPLPLKPSLAIYLPVEH